MSEWVVKNSEIDLSDAPSLVQGDETDRSKSWVVKNNDKGGSFERIAYEILGGMVGGAVASPGGITIPVGIGLGSAIGGKAYDIKEQMLGKKQPKSLMDELSGSAMDFTLNAVSPEAVSKGIYGAKKIFKSVVDKPVQHLFRPQAISKYAKFGLKPSAAMATQSKALMVAENALADYPFSAGVLQKNAQYNLSQLKFSAEYLAKEYGDILSKEEVGSLLKIGAKGATQKLDRIFGKLFGKVAQQIGDTPQSIDNTIGLLDTLYKEAKTGPTTGLPKILEEIFNKAAANKGGLPFESLKKYRSFIGDMMKDPTLISTRNIQSGDLKRIYAALTKDMEQAAVNAGPKAHASWRAANKYFENAITRKIPALEEIIKKGYDEQVFDIVMNTSQKGGSKLFAIRKQMTNEQWDVVAGSVLGKLGSPPASVQNATGTSFSINSFLTNWNKLSNGAKNALFKGNRYSTLSKELDDLVAVAGDFKNVEAIANKSKTGSVLMFFSLFQTLGGVTGGVAAGGSGALGGMAAATSLAVAPHYVAKLMTKPSFVRWLSKGVQIAKNSPNDMASHLGRLMILREYEDISNEINEVLKNVL